MRLRPALLGIFIAICGVLLGSSAYAQSDNNQPAPPAAPAPQPINPLTGPSFPCPQPTDPLAQLICSTPQLALLDMQFVQSYKALYQQVGTDADPALRHQDYEFDLAVRSQCNIAVSQGATQSPTPPPPAPAGAAQCVIPLYQQQIATWKAQLQGPALEEANRSIQDQLTLQSRLQALGFLPARAQIDGVFGTGTRAAIIQWQTSVGRQPTGLLGNADAQALLADLPQSTSTPSATPSAQTPSPPPTTPPQPAASVQAAWAPYAQYGACMLSNGFQLTMFIQDGVLPTDSVAASILNSCIEAGSQQQTAPAAAPSTDASTDTSANSGASSDSNSLNIGESVIEGPLKITVTKVEYLSVVGNSIINHPAPQNGTLVAVQYSFTNISGSPVDSSSQPDIHLLDTKAVSYDSDVDATADYDTQIRTTQKIISDLNPGITTAGTGVFEVSLAYFDPTSWHIYFGNDQNDLFSMPPLSNQASPVNTDDSNASGSTDSSANTNSDISTNDSPGTTSKSESLSSSAPPASATVVFDSDVDLISKIDPYPIQEQNLAQDAGQSILIHNLSIWNIDSSQFVSGNGGVVLRNDNSLGTNSTISCNLTPAASKAFLTFDPDQDRATVEVWGTISEFSEQSGLTIDPCYFQSNGTNQ
jgi:peptidoglycan hydrolase-like protein with peptidoglycan-binding domain